MVLISRYKGKLAEYGMQTDKNQRLKTEVKKLHWLKNTVIKFADICLIIVNHFRKKSVALQDK